MTILMLLLWATQGSPTNPTRPTGIVLAIVDQVNQKTAYLSEPNDPNPPISPEQDSGASPSQLALSAAETVPASEWWRDLNSGQPSKGQPESPRAPSLSDVEAMLNSTGGKGLSDNGPLSEEQLKELAEEQARVAAMKPVGEPISLSVFGSPPLTGRTFVFVLDQSDSMGSGGLGVLEASKSELQREIDKLHDYHQFQIVAYNEHTSVIGRRRLLAASDQNKRGVAAFIGGLIAAGGTNHKGGLMVALGFEPDVIVLISDGGEPALDENSLNLIQRVSRGQTQIHCLQFGIGSQPPETSTFMRRLADQNQGSYRYVDVSQWSANKD